jgi:hypothetical protein
MSLGLRGAAVGSDVVYTVSSECLSLHLFLRGFHLFLRAFVLARVSFVVARVSFVIARVSFVIEMIVCFLDV